MVFPLLRHGYHRSDSRLLFTAPERHAVRRSDQGDPPPLCAEEEPIEGECGQCSGHHERQDGARTAMHPQPHPSQPGETGPPSMQAGDKDERGFNASTRHEDVGGYQEKQWMVEAGEGADCAERSTLSQRHCRTERSNCPFMTSEHKVRHTGWHRGSFQERRSDLGAPRGDAAYFTMACAAPSPFYASRIAASVCDSTAAPLVILIRAVPERTR